MNVYPTVIVMIVVILVNKEKEDGCSVKFEQHSPEIILRNFEIILIFYFKYFEKPHHQRRCVI